MNSLIVFVYGSLLPLLSALHTYEDHPCKRSCLPRDTQTCHYEFHLEYYHALSKDCYNCPENITDCFRSHCVPADGTKRAILTVNRMLPGPAIHVCQNDTIEVKLYNELVGGEGTSIHWHGIHQRGSQHMDGVGLVTQCPLQESSSFLYRFSADPPGTHFWHAHTGLQRADGVFGALIVRQPPEVEPHWGLYDEDLPEHTILVNDWLHELTLSRFTSHYHAGGDNKPRAILINGKGLRAPYLNWNGTQTPVEIFHVTRGKRYRFRTISSGALNCPIHISIDNHTLTMIASDGNPFNKTEVESFTIFAGERYDFVLTASAAVGNYRIRATGLADCDFYHARQLAVLRYTGASEEFMVDDGASSQTGKILNPFIKPGTEDHVTVAQLASVGQSDRAALKEVPDKRFYLELGLYRINGSHYWEKAFMAQINHISLKLPSSPPLTQLRDINEDAFCNNDSVNMECSQQFCECVHRLQVALGDVVEMVVLNEGNISNASHPMHLHGHRFYVIGMDKLGDSTTYDEVKQLDNAGQLRRNLVNPVAKDTVNVPDGGYVILRFHADNPGFWYFHCHLEFHVAIGMGLIIQTGETNDIEPAPKNFPKCGNWDPDQDDQEVSGAMGVSQPAAWITGVLVLYFQL